MPVVSTTNITGNITLPNDTVPAKSSIIFTLSQFDIDDTADAVVLNRPIVAPIADDGSIDVDLWSNINGELSTVYKVSASVYNGSSDILIDIGRIEVPATGGPYNLDDLLQLPAPTTTPIEDFIALKVATEVAAAQAAAYDGPRFDTLDEFLADQGLTFDTGNPGTVSEGDYVRIGNQSYQVAADGAGDGHYSNDRSGADPTENDVELYEAGPDFSTRARMVAAWDRMTTASETLPVGTIWSDGTVSYVYDGTTTAISDMSGWRHVGVIRPQHFPGAANDAVKAAIAYANDNASSKVVDARLYESTVAITEDVWGGAVDVTLITGPVDWTFDTDACRQRPFHGCTIEAHGTTFKPDQDDAEGVGGSSLGFGMFTNHVATTTGSITSASSTLTVASTADLREGCTVAVQGLAGATSNQRTTLDGAIDASQTTITVTSTTGFDDAAVDVGAIQIDSEWITYTGKTATTFTGCTRGAFGTTAASHTDTTNVDMILDTVAKVESISGTSVTLDLAASATASSVRVRIGAMGLSFRGKATMDGRRGAAGAGLDLLEGISLFVTAGAYVSDDWTFHSWNHSGVNVSASLGFDINGAYERNGKAATGQDVFLFGQNRDGVVNTRYHKNTRVGVFVDDRSSSGGDSLIGENKRLGVRVGPARDTEIALAVAGTKNSTFSGPYLHGTDECIVIYTSDGQWTTPIATTGNYFDFGVVDGDSDAIRFGDGTSGVPAVDDGGNVVRVGTVLNGLVNRYNTPGNDIFINNERTVNKNTDTITTTRQNTFSIAASTWVTGFLDSGRIELLGGNICGYLPGVRITIDGTVVLTTESAARGDDEDGARFSVKSLPSNLRCEESMSIEFKNHDAGGARDYGWEIYTRKF